MTLPIFKVTGDSKTDHWDKCLLLVSANTPEEALALARAHADCERDCVEVVPRSTYDGPPQVITTEWFYDN